ncbi:PREDICTED: pumilio homolog 14-like [Brassica oleracea var. oleracea]|uniref:PUM-HD domain-containing protein n=1 Tax=Brassica oleracea var. oleracea TaxID=109376 RepID=A0A0D3BUH6_BRAOL|nr:PREDICTED: pumilio homolog 14-like [Brassica oleracea var. oleracea]
MESSRVNSTGGERDGNTTEENLSPAEMYRRGESRLQLSQFQPDIHRALDKQLFRFPTGLDVETLDSSFAMLSLRQQNPLLDNRWTNRSSLQQNHQGINGGGDVGGGGWSLPPQREVDLQQMMNHYFQRTSSTLNDYVNGGSYGQSSVSQDVPDLSRGRDYGFGSWRSNEGFVNPSSLSLENERMGPIALLAKDPKSTLVLQEKIDEGSKETIDVIFNDVISSIYELMEHPFASQVLQKLMHECSSQQISHIIDVITLNQLGFVKMCIDPVGTRSIQSLLSCLHSEEQILRLVGAVSVGILAFTRSNGAKHVIMQCFNQFPPSLNRDLIEVLVQNCFVLAIDQHGCCMLQQCLGTGCELLTKRLIREIIASALRLCVNNFGNYVVQYVVELNDPNVTILLVQQLFGNYALLSRNKYGSHVVQKFLKIHYIDHSMIVYDLLKDIDTLLVDPFGNYVIQTAWFVCEDVLRVILMRHIERNKPLMRCNKFGKKVLDKLNL